MKKAETIEVVRIYCDVCGALCIGSWATFGAGENEQHACSGLDDESGERCWDILPHRMRDNLKPAPNKV